jgi:hypothetical protein
MNIHLYVKNAEDRKKFYELAEILGYKCIGYVNPKYECEYKVIEKCPVCKKIVTNWELWSYHETYPDICKNGCNGYGCEGVICPNCNTNFSNASIDHDEEYCRTICRNNMLLISKNTNNYIPKGCYISTWYKNSRKKFRKAR